ncbi:M56 family metallopeptidase [Silvibacterium sp.]|uniref:M56 family metallopeptidase n=1 Tax=Silvibacterium sp. TaxID=1964179 RepID=UPI0039E70416
MTSLLTAGSTTASALVSATWQGAVLAAIVALCLRLAKGIPPAARSLLWTATFTLAVLLHLTPFLLHAPAVPHSGTVLPHAALHVDARWSLAITGLWLSAALFRLTQLAQSWVALRRIARSAQPVELHALPVHLLQAGRRTAQLCVSEEVDRPSVLGFFSPRVLIPAALYQQLTATELEHIVLHEMEHLRRRDDWVNLFQKLALALFPLNPAMFWVERQLSADRELACDDHVLARTHARKTYATCLVNLAEHSMLRRRLSLALGAWERRSELARRVLRILNQGETRVTTRRLRAVTAMLVAAMVGGTVELAREPRLVAFTPVAVAMAAASETADTVLPDAPSYLPAAMPGSHQPHAVDAVFHLPAQPSVGTPARTQQKNASHPGSRTGTKQISSQPHIVETSLRQPRMIPTQIAQAAPPAMMQLPDSAAVSLRAREARQEALRRVGAVVVLATWTEYVTPEQQDRSAAERTREQWIVAHPVPSYAAIPTPDGWLILQL